MLSTCAGLSMIPLSNLRYLQGACPSEAEEARDFNDCPFRYYAGTQVTRSSSSLGILQSESASKVLEVLTTAGEEAT